MSRVYYPRLPAEIVLPPAPESGPIVTPADWSDGDRSMARYFWTSTGKDELAFEASEAAIRRILNFGMKAKPVSHGTPFGHGHLTVHVERVPMPIGEQMTRHRVMVTTGDGEESEDRTLAVSIDWQPNISKKSYRYVTLTGGSRRIENGSIASALRAVSHAEMAEELFYVPRIEHLYGEEGSPGNYVRVPLPYEVRKAEQERYRRVYAYCLREYEEALANGASAEQARFLLPQGAYTRLYATESYRNWFNFCLARNDSHAQQEIRWIAEQVEEILSQAAPIAYELWVSHGRRMI
jgi:thymidylate synthase ThyX